MWTGRKSDRLVYRQTNKQADGQTDRLTDRPTDRPTDRQALSSRLTDSLILTPKSKHHLGSIRDTRPLGSVRETRPLGSVGGTRPLGSVRETRSLGSVGETLRLVGRCRPDGEAVLCAIEHVVLVIVGHIWVFSVGLRRPGGIVDCQYGVQARRRSRCGSLRYEIIVNVCCFNKTNYQVAVVRSSRQTASTHDMLARRLAFVDG